MTILPLGWRLEMHLVKIRPLGWRLDIHHGKLATILPLRWRLESRLCFGAKSSFRVEARSAHGNNSSFKVEAGIVPLFWWKFVLEGGGSICTPRTKPKWSYL